MVRRLTYIKKDSPWFYMNLRVPKHLRAPGEKARRQKPTGIPHAAPTAEERAALQKKAEAYARTEQAKLILARAEPEAAPVKPARLLRDHLHWYRDHVSPQNDGEAAEAYTLDAFAAGPLGAILLADLTAARLTEWMTARARQVKEGTVNREMDLLKSALKRAVPDYLAASPAAGLARLKVKKKTRIFTLTHEQEARLLAVLRPRDRALVTIALDSLIRLGDLINLQWADLHGKIVTVVDPKTEDAYKVILSARAMKALASLPREGLYVFPHLRIAQPKHRSNTVKQLFERACRKAGVPYGRGKGVTFHTATRHTGASRLSDAGYNTKVIQEFGGWKDERMVARYAHPNERVMAQAAEAIGARPKKKGAVLPFARGRKAG